MDRKLGPYKPYAKAPRQGFLGAKVNYLHNLIDLLLSVMYLSHEFSQNRHRRPNSQPAKELEAALGISGISGCYIFEEYDVHLFRDIAIDYTARLRNSSPSDIEAHALLFNTLSIKDEYIGMLQPIWEKLKEQNPALSQISITPGTTRDLRDSIYGAYSGFNVSDIQHYIDHSNMEHAAAGVYAWHVNGNVYSAGWKAAPSTAELVSQKLLEKAICFEVFRMDALGNRLPENAPAL